MLCDTGKGTDRRGRDIFMGVPCFATGLLEGTIRRPYTANTPLFIFFRAPFSHSRIRGLRRHFLRVGADTDSQIRSPHYIGIPSLWALIVINEQRTHILKVVVPKIRTECNDRSRGLLEYQGYVYTLIIEKR